MERADQVFARPQIYAHFAANGAVNLRQESSRHLDKGDATQVRSGDEASEITHHAATQCDDE